MTLQEPLVYICGEANFNNSVESPSLKDILITNLATRWPVRTHQSSGVVDPRTENNDLFQIVRHCSVFIFIYSKKTLEDTFYLNQYGVAKSYGIPVIGVRLTNYFLQGPIPGQYYSTEIVDNSHGTYNRNTSEAAKKRVSLAEHLVADFKIAMVYGPDFHRSCIERLTHKVAQANNKRENQKELLERAATYVSKASSDIKARNIGPREEAKCPKCGFFLRDFRPPKLQRASSTGSLLRRSNTLEQLPIKSAVTRNRTPLQPSRIQIPSPHPMKKLHTSSTSAYGNWTLKQEQRFTEPKISQLKPTSVSPSESPKNEIAPPPPTNPTIFRRQSRAQNGTWTEKLRNKLRRQSSLPVIPTTYLVTTPDGLEKQISLVRYPPEKREAHSPRGSDNLTMFSEDEDQETIHISRVPSPDVPSG